jgi:uncharacterized SAM-binding protein YcdF (DUF218 family)
MLPLLQLKTLLRDLVLPPASLLLLGLLGLWLLARRPRLARILIALSLGSLWLLATPIVADAITRRSEPYAPLDWSQAASAQAIVILGGGEHRDWAPEYGGPAADAVLLDRLAYGAFVARRTGLPILVTGYRIEASAMRESLRRSFGIDPRWVDDQSYDTFQNAQHAVRILQADGIHRLILVTSGTHMRRSLREFTAAGAEVVPAPHGMLGPSRIYFRSWIPRPDSLLRSYASLYELLGAAVQWFLDATHLRRQ